MYIWALYIGLSASVMTYLSVQIVPAYAVCIHQGYEPDERLWWRLFRQRSSSVHKQWHKILYGLSLGLVLIVACVFHPWLIDAPALNIALMSIWLGSLGLLAQIDRLCWLLPDVLTQLLLWVGLLLQFYLNPATVGTAVLAATVVYLFGRSLNIFAYFWVKQNLFGLGDVKLLAAVAVWLDLQLIIPIFCLATVGCYAVAALEQQRWQPRGVYAFGPYIVFATIVVWCLQR